MAKAGVRQVSRSPVFLMSRVGLPVGNIANSNGHALPSQARQWYLAQPAQHGIAPLLPLSPLPFHPLLSHEILIWRRRGNENDLSGACAAGQNARESSLSDTLTRGLPGAPAMEVGGSCNRSAADAARTEAAGLCPLARPRLRALPWPRTPLQVYENLGRIGEVGAGVRSRASGGRAVALRWRCPLVRRQRVPDSTPPLVASFTPWLCPGRAGHLWHGAKVPQP